MVTSTSAAATLDIKVKATSIVVKKRKRCGSNASNLAKALDMALKMTIMRSTKKSLQRCKRSVLKISLSRSSMK